jgi:hypothetical protein
VPKKPQQLLPFSTAKQANLLLNGHPLDSVKHEDVNKTLRLQSTHHEPHTYPNQKQKDHKSRQHNKTVSPTTTGFPYLRDKGPITDYQTSTRSKKENKCHWMNS